MTSATPSIDARGYSTARCRRVSARISLCISVVSFPSRAGAQVRIDCCVRGLLFSLGLLSDLRRRFLSLSRSNQFQPFLRGTIWILHDFEAFDFTHSRNFESTPMVPEYRQLATLHQNAFLSEGRMRGNAARRPDKRRVTSILARPGNSYPRCIARRIQDTSAFSQAPRERPPDH